MYFRLFLVPALLSGCAGESSVHGPPERVLAFAGEDVILPCTFSISSGDDFPTVEWSKEDLQPNVVFLYRDGCETYEMKNAAFHYRTSFIVKELKNGNISLRISNLQLSDAGMYQCLRLWKNAPRDVTTVELVVGAFSEPKLSVVSADSGGVTLHCEAPCWLPEPHIQFVDDRGNDIAAEEPKRRQDAGGCFTVTRRATLQEAASSVTCRVHQPQINQTRRTEILIPVGCMRSCFLTAAIAVGVTVLLLFSSCGLAVALWKSCGRSAERQKLPVTRQPSDQSVACDDEPLLQSVRVDGAERERSCTTKKPRGAAADRKSKLREKDKAVRQLQTNNSKPPQSSAVCQLDQPAMVSPAASTNSNPPKSANLPQSQGPKPGTSPRRRLQATGHQSQRTHRIHSSPAVLSLGVAASLSSSQKKLDRQTSESSAPAASNAAKLQRRHSSAVPSSTLFHNRFTLLADLKEEPEIVVPLKKGTKVNTKRKFKF